MTSGSVVRKPLGEFEVDLPLLFRGKAHHSPQTFQGIDMGTAKTPGVYLLLIRLRRRRTAEGGRRRWELRRGWYVYAGSAIGGLEGRLGRHLRTSQVRHWHIDHLLAAGTVKDV